MRIDKDNKFLLHNLIFFMGTGAIGALNYLYYPLLSHVLSVGQFGEIQALFSLLTELSILFAALGLVIVHITVNSRRTEANELLLEIEKVGAGVLGLLGLVWLASVGLISHFLKMGDQAAVGLFYAAVLLSYFASTRQAAVQGSEDFTGLTKSGVLGAVIKLVSSLLLVLAGLGVLGAVLGLIIGQLVMLGYTLFISRRHGFATRMDVRATVDWLRLKREIRYVIPVFIVSLAITFLFSSDILVIKHFFSPQIAGHYAGVAAIGRIIIFLTASINGVMFTKLKPDYSAALNRATLWKSTVLFGFLGGGSALAMIVAPKLIIRLLLGSRYLEQAAILPWLALTLFLLAGVNLIAYYDLALRRKRAAIITGGGAIGGFGLIALSHNSVRSVIFDLLYATIGMIAIRGLLGVRSWQQRRRDYGENGTTTVNHHSGA